MNAGPWPEVRIIQVTDLEALQSIWTVSKEDLAPPITVTFLTDGPRRKGDWAASSREWMIGGVKAISLKVGRCGRDVKPEATMSLLQV